MFSGKTGLLLEHLAAAEQRGTATVALKPSIDTRGAATLTSHAGRSHPATLWSPTRDLLSLVRAARLVVVDEVQFLPPAAIADLESLRKAGRTVVAAGLDLDFRRQPFPATAQLVAAADGLVTLTAICGNCLRPAPFTQRLSNGRPAPFEEETVRIGAADLYQPRCPECYEAERQSPSDPVPSLARRGSGARPRTRPLRGN